MLIDFHTHVFPDAIAEGTIARLADRGSRTPHGKLTPCGTGTVSDLLRHMRESGVSLSLNLPILTKPAQYRTVNDFAAALNARGQGIVSFGGIHPDSEDIEGELDGILARGLRGIKLHPDFQGTVIDDPRYARIIGGALDRDLHVVTHAGLDRGFPDFMHCPPEASRRLIEVLGDRLRRSRGRLIFAHLGGNEQWDAVRKYLVGQPVLLDLSFVIRRMPREQLLSIIRAHGAENVLFGSDYPWSDAAADAAYLAELGLGEGELADILYRNACRLLEIKI